jgi:hypothetical protein
LGALRGAGVGHFSHDLSHYPSFSFHQEITFFKTGFPVAGSLPADLFKPEILDIVHGFVVFCLKNQ